MAATHADPLHRIGIVGDRRRAHDAAFRRTVVTESLSPGARVQEVARRHGICPSLVYRWRRIAEASADAGSAVRLMPVRITAEPETARTQAARGSEVPTPRPSGLIEIEFTGGVRVRVDDSVSLVALRRVISVLRG